MYHVPAPAQGGGLKASAAIWYPRASRGVEPFRMLQAHRGRHMQIWVNGEAREIDEGRTLGDLVRELDLDPQGVAVEVNREVVPRASHGDYRLREADRIEVVRAIGGG